MRKETDEWLSLLVEAARERGIDTDALRDQAFPQADASHHDLFVKRIWESDSEVRSVELDGVRYGQLLIQALGWENSYPAVPDFPELRDEF